MAQLAPRLASGGTPTRAIIYTKFNNKDSRLVSKVPFLIFILNGRTHVFALNEHTPIKNKIPCFSKVRV